MDAPYYDVVYHFSPNGRIFASLRSDDCPYMDSSSFASILFGACVQREAGRIEFEPGFVKQVDSVGPVDDPEHFIHGLRLQN